MATPRHSCPDRHGAAGIEDHTVWAIRALSRETQCAVMMSVGGAGRVTSQLASEAGNVRARPQSD